ncbi:hypothetical protein BDV93DRAFT_573165 [Ceratobasidium sp. AG-I]|nr:hypothetical protein BDV93DRAFT_573165 [Ceratobasidium sp. AG-I]
MKYCISDKEGYLGRVGLGFGIGIEIEWCFTGAYSHFTSSLYLSLTSLARKDPQEMQRRRRAQLSQAKSIPPANTETKHKSRKGKERASPHCDPTFGTFLPMCTMRFTLPDGTTTEDLDELFGQVWDPEEVERDDDGLAIARDLLELIGVPDATYPQVKASGHAFVCRRSNYELPDSWDSIYGNTMYIRV